MKTNVGLSNGISIAVGYYQSGFVATKCLNFIDDVTFEYILLFDFIQMYSLVHDFICVLQSPTYPVVRMLKRTFLRMLSLLLLFIMV